MMPSRLEDATKNCCFWLRHSNKSVITSLCPAAGCPGPERGVCSSVPPPPPLPHKVVVPEMPPAPLLSLLSALAPEPPLEALECVVRMFVCPDTFPEGDALPADR